MKQIEGLEMQRDRADVEECWRCLETAEVYGQRRRGDHGLVAAVSP